MFGKHALAAKILQEAKDQGITLKQHLDYELRFKKRDQERFNANFAMGE